MQADYWKKKEKRDFSSLTKLLVEVKEHIERYRDALEKGNVAVMKDCEEQISDLAIGYNFINHTVRRGKACRAEGTYIREEWEVVNPIKGEIGNIDELEWKVDCMIYSLEYKEKTENNALSELTDYLTRMQISEGKFTEALEEHKDEEERHMFNPSLIDLDNAAVNYEQAIDGFYRLSQPKEFFESTKWDGIKSKSKGMAGPPPQ